MCNGQQILCMKKPLLHMWTGQKAKLFCWGCGGFTQQPACLEHLSGVGRGLKGIKKKVCAKLSKWKWLLSQLAYRRRILVSKNLFASALWHRFTVLSPPKNLVKETQRNLVDFFWSGKYWVRAAILFLPTLTYLRCWRGPRANWYFSKIQTSTYSKTFVQLWSRLAWCGSTAA